MSKNHSMKQITIYILLIIITLGSCTQSDLVAPLVEEPVFTIESTLDNEALNWEAGNDNVYMFTEYSIDSLDIYTFTGRLAKDSDCTIDCEESLTFSIRSSYATPTLDDFNIDEALIVSDYGYYLSNGSGVTGHIYTFDGALDDPIFGTQAVEYLWTINGNIINSPSGSVISYFDSLGNDFNIRLEMSNPNQCTSYIQKTISAGQINTCDLILDVVPVFDSTQILEYQFSINPPSGINGTTYLWGNSIISADSFTLSPFTQLPNNILNFSIIDSLGTCGVDMGICISSNGGSNIQGISIPELNYSVEPIATMDNEQFSKVIIEYKNADGIVYSSANTDFDNNAFTITKIEDFENNENGEKTKKLTIDYSATLYTPNGDSKFITGEGVIAIAYPE